MAGFGEWEQDEEALMHKLQEIQASTLSDVERLGAMSASDKTAFSGTVAAVTVQLSQLRAKMRDLELLAEEADTEEECGRLAGLLQQQKREYERIQGAFRVASVQARRNAEAAALQERQALLAGAAPGLRQRKLQGEADTVAVAEDITESLRRTRQLMAQELEHTSATLAAMDTSTGRLGQAGGEFRGQARRHVQSKQLLRTMYRHSIWDHLVLYGGLAVFLVVALYILQKRVLYFMPAFMGSNPTTWAPPPPALQNVKFNPIPDDAPNSWIDPAEVHMPSSLLDTGSHASGGLGRGSVETDEWEADEQWRHPLADTGPEGLSSQPHALPVPTQPAANEAHLVDISEQQAPLQPPAPEVDATPTTADASPPANGALEPEEAPAPDQPAADIIAADPANPTKATAEESLPELPKIMRQDVKYVPEPADAAAAPAQAPADGKQGVPEKLIEQEILQKDAQEDELAQLAEPAEDPTEPHSDAAAPPLEAQPKDAALQHEPQLPPLQESGQHEPADEAAQLTEAPAHHQPADAAAEPTEAPEPAVLQSPTGDVGGNDATAPVDTAAAEQQPAGAAAPPVQVAPAAEEESALQNQEQEVPLEEAAAAAAPLPSPMPPAQPDNHDIGSSSEASQQSSDTAVSSDSTQVPNVHEAEDVTSPLTYPASDLLQGEGGAGAEAELLQEVGGHDVVEGSAASVSQQHAASGPQYREQMEAGSPGLTEVPVEPPPPHDEL